MAAIGGHGRFVKKYYLIIVLFPAVAASGHQLRLPLQYDRYLPWSARSLGMGSAAVAGGGASALFGQPDRTGGLERWEAGVSSAALSAGRSHVSIESEASRAAPSAAAAAFRLGGHVLAFGCRRAVDVRISFPDVYAPLLSDHAALELDQAVLGWAYSTAGNASIGFSLGASRAGFDWRGPDRAYAAGEASGFGFSAGLTIPVTGEIKLSLAAAAKSELKGTADFLPDPAAGDLELSGAVPSRTAAAVEYRPETGLILVAEAAMSGWNTVTQGYEGRIDLHLGAEVQILETLALRLGGFTMTSPLDEYERRLDATLRDGYFLTAGLGLSCKGFYLDLGGASSRPLSGGGQSQNRLAVSAGFGR